MNAFAEALERISRMASGTKPGEKRTGKPAQEKKAVHKPIRKRPAYPVIIASIAVLMAVVFGLGFLFKDNLFPGVFSQPSTATLLVNVIPSKTKFVATPTKLMPVATKTVRPTPTPIKPSPTPEKPVINLENAQRVIQQKRIDKISVIDMDWIDNGNWLIDSGSQKVSFIDTGTETRKEVPLPSEIPLSMAIAPSTGKVFLLFNDKIQVVDINTFKVTNTFAPIAGGARSIAVSPDGKLLALGISDNKTQLLNATEGSVIRNLKSNYGGWVVTFSPDSKYVTSGTSQGVLKWETDTGLWRPIQSGQEAIIKSLTISHNGKLLAGGGNGVIFIWNLDDGQQLQMIKRDFGVVNGLDFSPDDSILVSGTGDGIVRIWNVSSGTLLKEMTGHTSEIAAVCFSPDGQYIASGAVNDASIRIWGLP
jgi:WD40 repeat protein